MKMMCMKLHKTQLLVRGTPVMMRSTLYLLRFWGVYIIKNTRFFGTGYLGHE